MRRTLTTIFMLILPSVLMAGETATNGRVAVPTSAPSRYSHFDCTMPLTRAQMEQIAINHFLIDLQDISTECLRQSVNYQAKADIEMDKNGLSLIWGQKNNQAELTRQRASYFRTITPDKIERQHEYLIRHGFEP